VHKNFSKLFPRQISEKSKEKEKDKKNWQCLGEFLTAAF
jgi:hypothetical protein